MKYLILLLAMSAGAQEYSIESVIDTLIRLESTNGIDLYGDKKNGVYRGVGDLQIWETRVDDINAICEKKGYPYRFTYADRLCPKEIKIDVQDLMY